MSRPATALPTTAAAPRPPHGAAVPAVARAMALLDRLASQRQPMRMAQLATELDLPRSSVHGLCTTLLSLGYLRRQADGGLSIGPRVMALSEAFVASTDVAREFDLLWAAAGPADPETTVLSVLDGADVVYLGVRNSRRPLDLAFTPGMRLPAHLAATGRAMLACRAAALRPAAPAAALPALTPRSLTDPAALARELAATRARGYAIDDEGVRLGVYGLAAAVLDAGGRAVAGVGLCLNKATLAEAELPRLQQQVLALARALSQRLGGLVPAAISDPYTPARSA